MNTNIRGVQLYFENMDEGLPIITLHGFPTDHRAMKGMLEPIFAKRTGYRRLYLDLPGMGKSQSADWITGTDQVLETITHFIDEVIPDEPFLIAGHSYGGYLARGLLKHKQTHVKGMLLVAPSDNNPGKRILPKPFHAVVDKLALDNYPAEQREMLAQTMVIQTEETLARVRQEIFPGLALADGAACNRIRQTYAFSFNPDDLQTPFDKPVLIITGRHDAVTGYDGGKKLIDLYKRVTFATLDNAGHGVHIEQPTLFNALVSEWLERVEKNSQSPKENVLA